MSTLTRRIAADPDEVFWTVTDVSGLPDWNHAITRVLEVPDELAAGSEWVVEVRALGQRWPSRSRLEELDPQKRRFSYRSGTDDGNPSYATWTWTVTAAPGGCEVAVTWRVNPRTFWRRVLFARVRKAQLRRHEVPASLVALGALQRDDRQRSVHPGGR
ncbi:hypothetical protein NBCG_02420 [Nocardioidaceae bacterium Broad-1]|nr:hypothetical protein NBCG_02420 [Nocardioidaceae bacterium Broad-1]